MVAFFLSSLLLSVSGLKAADIAAPTWKIVSNSIPAGGIGFLVQIEPTDDSSRTPAKDRRMSIHLREGELTYFDPRRQQRLIRLGLKDGQELERLTGLLRDYDSFYKKMASHPDPRNAGSEREAFVKSAEAYQGGLGSIVDPEDIHWRDFLGGAYLVFNKGPGKGTFLAEPTGLYWTLANLAELRQMEKEVAAERSEEVTRQRQMALETAKSKSAEDVKAYEQKKRELQEFKAFQQQLLGIQTAEVDAKLDVDQRLDQEAEAKVRAYIATPGGRDLAGRIESLARKIFSAREQNRIELEKKLKPVADEQSKLWKLRADPNTTSKGEDMVIDQIAENRFKMSKIAKNFGDTRVTAFDAEYSELVRKFELGSGIKFNVAAPLLRRLGEEEGARSKEGK